MMERSEAMEEMPLDNEGWFKRHIIQQLSDLKKGQEESGRRQEVMHTANVSRMDAITKSLNDHAEDDQRKFTAIEKGVTELQPIKKVVYAAVGLILVAVMTGLLALVVRQH